MSINFHAYQCRGYLLSDYEEIEKQWQTIFTDYNPDRAAQILELEKDDNYLYIRYFQTLYRLHLKTGTLEKRLTEKALTEKERLTDMKKEDQTQISSKLPGSSYLKIPDAGKLYLQDTETARPSENGWTGKVYFNEAMVIYHLLHYVKDHPAISGTWIPNSQLDTRAARNNQREDLLLSSFCAEFTGKMDRLEVACQSMNGIPIQTRADISYQFYAFPQVPLQLLFWDADEDFPAQVQILVDQHVTDYVHLETTGCMVSDLFEKLTASVS